MHDRNLNLSWLNFKQAIRAKCELYIYVILLHSVARHERSCVLENALTVDYDAPSLYGA